MAGRTPKPTALKLLTGNPGKRPLNTDEPQPPPGIPGIPAWLSDKARPHWDELAPLLQGMTVLTVADGAALALLCDALSEYVQARAVVARRGATYESKSIAKDDDGKAVVHVVMRTRPEVGIAQSAWQRAKVMMSEFGLTPASRSRIHAGGKAEEADPFEAFLSKGAD